jgi:hypothetical protein
MKRKDRDFACGVATALAEVYRRYGEDVIIKEVLDGLGFSLAHLISARADDDDLIEIKMALEEGSFNPSLTTC